MGTPSCYMIFMMGNTFRDFLFALTSNLGSALKRNIFTPGDHLKGGKLVAGRVASFEILPFHLKETWQKIVNLWFTRRQNSRQF